MPFGIGVMIDGSLSVNRYEATCLGTSRDKGRTGHQLAEQIERLSGPNLDSLS